MIISGRSESALPRVVAKSARRSFLLTEKALPAPLLLLFPLETLCWFLAGALWPNAQNACTAQKRRSPEGLLVGSSEISFLI